MGDSSLADRIRSAREARGLSMNDLARRAKVSPATIHNLESGKRQPHPSTLRKILTALDKTPKLPDVL
jgi:transcriptional regulator with XRE-family HTH domain